MKNIKIGYELTSGYFFNCSFICNIYRENWKFQNTLDHCSLCYTEDLRDELHYLLKCDYFNEKRKTCR
jgi:hypothetical protein